MLKAETLTFDWVIREIARNQIFSGNLVESNMVPAVTNI